MCGMANSFSRASPQFFHFSQADLASVVAYLLLLLQIFHLERADTLKLSCIESIGDPLKSYNVDVIVEIT